MFANTPAHADRNQLIPAQVRLLVFSNYLHVCAVAFYLTNYNDAAIVTIFSLRLNVLGNNTILGDKTVSQNDKRRVFLIKKID